MLNDVWNGIIGFAGQFVVPDWASLIPLIPVALAAVVLLYLGWVTYRLATAPPTRRGVRRVEPVAPAGVHMPGPSFAPPLAAFGAFMLVFGVIAHGIWFWVGVAVLLVTLLYWGREALRDYDRIPGAPAGPRAAAVALSTAGAGLVAHGSGTGAGTASLQPPAVDGRTPPPGVHLPPPSFRPLLVSVALTILVVGIFLGGLALVVGIVALAVACLGWLRDARREYVAVEVADRTGHVDLGGAPSWPTRTFGALAVLVALALVVSSGILPNSGGGGSAAGGAGGGAGSPGPSQAGGPGGAGANPTPAPSGPAGDVTIVAEKIAFSTAAVSAPAGKAFTIAFDNRDQGVPHDVVVKNASGGDAFRGEIVTGPKVEVYQVPALAAGSYSFVCSVHPNMTGTLTAQ